MTPGSDYSNYELSLQVLEIVRPYLEEKTEADPLVVLVISSLQRVLSLVHSRVGHVEPNPLPECAGNCVGGVDPAVRVQNVLG